MVNKTSTFKSLIDITPRSDKVFVKGQGSWLYDSNQHKYLDYIQGWSVNTLGHCPPSLIQVIKEQSETLLNPSPQFYNNRMIELADLIAENSVRHPSEIATPHHIVDRREASDRSLLISLPDE